MNTKNISFLVTAIYCSCLLMTTGCVKDDEPTVITFETDSIMDIDGNVYKTVKIGDQWWMAENLKTTMYSDSTFILKVGESVTDDVEWSTNVTGACCFYDGNDKSPGRLYNWYAVVNAGGLAPLGWHVATEDDWKKLEMHLGMSSDDANKLTWRGTGIGDKLKVKAPENWTVSENVWGSNEAGFSALAGSCRIFDGTPGQPGLGSTGFWWAASADGADDGWYRYLDYKNTSVFRSHVSKNYGMSVRCVKDN